MDKRKHYWLYVLQLEQDKKYVGITTKTPEIRMQQHRNEFLGAAWTKKYKPVRLFDRKDLGLMSRSKAEKYENKVVRAYINKYGYNNVRGGDLSFSGEYIKRFGYYIDKESWSMMISVIILVSIIILQGIMYYLK